MKVSTFVLATFVSISMLIDAQTVAPVDQATFIGKLTKSCAGDAADDESQSSLKEVPSHLACQQFRIWTFPARLASPKVLVPALAVSGITAGLIFADRGIARDIRGTTAFGQFNRVLSSDGTKFATLAMPLAFYGAGLIKSDRYAQRTAIEAGEALLDAEILSLSLNRITQRSGPAGFSPTTPQSRTDWFSGRTGSFPSGHTASAFAVASVFARRYHSHKWVPYAAYGAASAIALSRLTTLSHYSSDVFFGAALGFSIGQFAVGPENRRF